MKRMFVLSLVLAIVLIGIAPPASLAENPANYVALKAGLYSPSASFDLDNFNGGTTTHFDSKTGFAGEIAEGTRRK